MDFCPGKLRLKVVLNVDKGLWVLSREIKEVGLKEIFYIVLIARIFVLYSCVFKKLLSAVIFISQYRTFSFLFALILIDFILLVLY